MKHRTAAMIFHYERSDLTSNVLAQLQGANCDVYVFDDGSSELFCPDTRRIGRLFQYEYKRFEENTGFVKAVNAAVDYFEEQSTYNSEKGFPRLEYEAYWMLNNDISGISGRMLEKLESSLFTYHDNKLAVVSPAIQPNGHDEMMVGVHTLSTTNFIDWVCPLVRAQAWSDVGGFDPNISGFGCDLDWCKRARQRNWWFAVNRKMVVRHQVSATVKSVDGHEAHMDMELMNQYLTNKWKVSHWSDLKL